MKNTTIILFLSLLFIPGCFAWPQAAEAPSEEWVEIDLLGYWGRLFNRSSELDMAFPGEFGKYDELYMEFEHSDGSGSGKIELK